MQRFVFPRWGLPVAVTLLALGSLSPTGLDPRVATGELAVAQRAWADCSQTVFPAQDPIADLADTAAVWGQLRGGQQLWPQWRITTPPPEAVWEGEAVAGDEAVDAPYDATPWEAAPRGGPSAGDDDGAPRVSTRRDVWFDATTDRLTTVTSTASLQGCTRIVLSANRNLQIGVRASDVSGLGGMRVSYPEIKPEDHRGNALIRIYRDGRPVPFARIRIWVDRIGDYSVPGIEGAGFGHEHVAADAEAPPSMQLVMFPLGQGDSVRVLRRGQILESRVDGNGEYTFGLQTGFRGGVERVVVEWLPSGGGPAGGQGGDAGDAALLARANPPATGNKAAISVAARHGRLRHWHTSLASMHTGPKTEGLQYPFILVGQSAQHQLTHYIEPTVLFDFYNALLDLWRQDLTELERYKAVRWAGEPPRVANDTTKPAAKWLQLSDMSLEYGGVFSTSGAGHCLDPMVGNHTGHTIGIDLDLAPCYTDNDGRPVAAAQCRSGNDPARGLRQVKFSLLEAIMARQFKAAVYAHGEGGGDPNASATGTFASYHIRMPLRGGLIPLVNQR